MGWRNRWAWSVAQRSAQPAVSGLWGQNRDLTAVDLHRFGLSWPTPNPHHPSNPCAYLTLLAKLPPAQAVRRVGVGRGLQGYGLGWA